MRLYAPAMKPVKKLAMSIRFNSTNEFVPNVLNDYASKFWAELMDICSRLEKLTILKCDSPRPTTALGQRPKSPDRWQQLRKSKVRDSLNMEHSRGRYTQLQLEWRHCTSDI